jgi:hypothetical protein
MSSIIKTPGPESGTPPPYDAPFPGDTQPRRRSHRWVWIVALLCILGGTLLALGAGWAITTYYNSTLRASDMYYSAIKTQDYGTAYTNLGSRLQTEYGQRTFIQAAQQQDAALGRVSRFGMTNIPTGDPAYVT